MSQHGRTSQPHTDLTKKSVAGTIQGAIRGADAGPAAAMDDYDKSSAVTAYNVNTTPTGAIGGIDEEVEKLENAELEAKRSRVVQEAAEVSSIGQKAVAGFSRAKQEAEYWSAIHDAATKLSSIVREVETKLSSAIQESTAEYSTVLKRFIENLLIGSRYFTELRERGGPIAGTVQCDLGGANAGTIDDYDKSGAGAVDNANTTPTGAGGSVDKQTGNVQNAEKAAKVLSFIKQDLSNGVQRAKVLLSTIKEATEISSIYIRESRVEFSRAIQESTAKHERERGTELAIAFQQIKSLLLFSILEAGIGKGSNSVLDTGEETTVVQQTIEVWRIVDEATANFSLFIMKSSTEFARAIKKSTAKYSSVYQQRAGERKIAFQDTAHLLSLTILKAAIDKVSNSVLEVAEVSSAVHEAVAEASSNLQEVATEWLKFAEEEAEIWHTIQVVEASHAAQDAATKVAEEAKASQAC